MKKIIITLNIFIILSCSQQDESITSEEITYEYSPQASLDLYVQGHRFIDQGKYKEAQKTYEKLTIIDPEFSKAWEGLADSSLLQSDLPQAISYIEKALEINPSIASHYSKKALILYYLDEYDPSERFANYALDIDKNDVRAIIVSAAVKAHKGLLDQSNVLFETAISLEPDDSSIYYWKAKSYREFDIDLNQSMDLINTAIEMDRSAPAYFIERGLLYFTFGELEKAEKDLLEAIEIAKNPRNQSTIDKANQILEDVRN